MISDKQEMFCQEFMIDFNATQAAIRAGYSPKTAKQQGSRLLTNVDIQERLSELKNKASERLEITHDMLLRELANIGFSDIKEFYEEGLSLKEIVNLSSDKTKAISSIKKTLTTFGSEDNQGTKETIEFKLHDKLAAIDKIGRHIGFFEKDNDQKGKRHVFLDDFGDDSEYEHDSNEDKEE